MNRAQAYARARQAIAQAIEETNHFDGCTYSHQEVVDCIDAYIAATFGQLDIDAVRKKQSVIRKVEFNE